MSALYADIFACSFTAGYTCESLEKQRKNGVGRRLYLVSGVLRYAGVSVVDSSVAIRCLAGIGRRRVVLWYLTALRIIYRQTGRATKTSYYSESECPE